MDAKLLDDPEITLKRISVLKNKKFLRALYNKFYSMFRQESSIIPGLNLELGSGAGFIKEIIPSAITSDIMPLKNCDLCFSAESMPLENQSVSNFFLLNSFHHIKNPKRALAEMQRCLKVGGRVIMIEPGNCLWGAFIYKYFHHENFDPEGSWKSQEEGALSKANGALTYIIFVRDLVKFNNLFPNLKVVKYLPHTPFSYLLSGGFTFPQLSPSFLFPFVQRIEFLISPLNKYLGMFVTVVIEKA